MVSNCEQVRFPEGSAGGTVTLARTQGWLRPSAGPFLTSCAALVGLVLVAAAGAAAPAATKDPNSIGCPAPPSGWDSPAVSKSVITPDTVPDALDPDNGGELEAEGGNAATVSCSYHHTAATAVDVVVSYALPVDPNPFADFDFGCGTGAVSWSASTRVFRVSSPKEWALATLDDAYGDLSASEVPEFEDVTRQLLDNAAGYGHSCSLVTKPTKVAAKVQFDIYVAGANLKDTFYTSQTKKKSGVYPITKISALTAALQLRTSAGTRPLTIKLIEGIDYRTASAKVSGRVRFRVQVTASKVAACAKGATGTLTISTVPVVQLHVCGRTFLPGPAPRSVDFNN